MTVKKILLNLNSSLLHYGYIGYHLIGDFLKNFRGCSRVVVHVQAHETTVLGQAVRIEKSCKFFLTNPIVREVNAFDVAIKL